MKETQKQLFMLRNNNKQLKTNNENMNENKLKRNASKNQQKNSDKPKKNIKFHRMYCKEEEESISKPHEETESSEREEFYNPYYDPIMFLAEAFLNSDYTKEFLLKKKNKSRFLDGFYEEQTQQFNNNLETTKHRQRYIKGEKNYVCQHENCERSFTSKYGLTYHLKNGHDNEKNNVGKPYKCHAPGCNKSYKNANGLKYHLNKTHQDL